MKRAYIAGPMRGYDRFNFPAFDECRDFIREEIPDVEIVSPADMDRAIGFDETRNELGSFDVKEAMRRDIAEILTCTDIIMLPGWHNSGGAKTEKAVAEKTGLKVWYFTPPGHLSTTPTQVTITAEAESLVLGDRGAAYGRPGADFERTAGVIAALTGWPVEARHIPVMMIAVKLSRHMNGYKRDSLVDIAGYALTAEMEEADRNGDVYGDLA